MANVKMRRMLWCHTGVVLLALALDGAVGRATSLACDAAPTADCPTAFRRRAQLLLNNHLKPVFLDRRVVWQWKRFTAATTDFGSPDTTTSFELCVYDFHEDVPALRYRFAIPAGGRCGKRPCWNRTPTGWQYRNAAGEPDGVIVVQLEGNDAGPGQLTIRGSGPHLLPFGLPLTKQPEVVAQLNTSDGRCWATHFHRAQRNYVGQFMAKSD